MLEYRKGICHGYQDHTRKEMNNAETEVANFFEYLGVFHKNLGIPPVLIWELYSVHIENIWPILKDKISRRRDQEDDPTFFSEFEDLWKAMQDYSKEKEAPSKQKTKDKIWNAMRDHSKKKETLIKDETKDKIERYVKRELKELAEDLRDS